MTETAIRITGSTTVNVGDRVRLIDAGGDASSTARVGDMGTVRRAREWLLDVTMDDGHETARNRDRWELVTAETPAELSEAEQRAIWAALPIEEAYPIGSKWHHRSYGDAVYRVVAINEDNGTYPLLMMSEDGSTNTWRREALDTYGTLVGLESLSPVAEEFPIGYRFKGTGIHDGDECEVTGRDGDDYVVSMSCGITDGHVTHEFVARGEALPVVESTETPEEPVAAAQEPYKPAVGDRVIVVRDVDEPSNVGKSAEVVDVEGYSSDRHIRVRYDDRQHGGEYGWWVGEVKPEMPATPEEYRAAIERAREEGMAFASANLESDIRTARREGRQEATQEAAEHMERIVESAHQYAYDNSLCSQFDRFMVENGLRPRDTYTQSYAVDVSYRVYVDATPGDSDAIRDAAMEAINSSYGPSPEIDWEES